MTTLDIENCFLRLNYACERILAMSSQPAESARAVSRESDDIAAAKRGDSDAFARLLKQNQAEITKQMYRFSRRRIEVEALVHDVFVEAFLSLKSFRGQAPFIHWLRKIAVRVGYRFWKHQETSGKSLPLEEDSFSNRSTSEQSCNLDNTNKNLRHLVNSLAPRDRVVLTLIYWDGCSIAEAAELSGWTRAMVKVQAHRARKRLKKMIEESNNE